MSTVTNTTDNISNFMKQCIAAIKGDDAEVTALKIQKRATAALNSQISSKTGTLVKLEEAEEDAAEALAQARINKGARIKDNKAYLVSLMTAESNLADAKQCLTDHQKTIDFLKAQLVLVKK